MTTTRKALGKGLRSLIPEAPARVPKAPAPEAAPKPGAGEPIQLIDIDRIRANRKQPRQRHRCLKQAPFAQGTSFLIQLGRAKAAAWIAGL